MTGRLALLLVAAMTAAMIVVNATMNTGDAVDNFAMYFNRASAFDIALSGANMAADAMYFNKFFRGHWRDNVDFNGGTLDVTIENAGPKIQVTSTGAFPATGGDRQVQQVVFYLQPGYFDRYVVLTDNDDGSVPWTTYDTAYGALHSNNTLRMDHYSGSTIMPVFNGRVTTLRPVTITAGTVPVFTQRPESGVLVEFPTAFDPVPVPPMLAGGGDFNSSFTAGNGLITVATKKELHLQFFVDASGQQMVRYFRDFKRTSNNGYGAFRSTDTVMTVPPSGIIYEPGVDVFVEGTIQGKVSVLTVPDAAGRGGNIFVTNDLLCRTSPRSNPNSRDFIGLLAYKNVIIANTMNDNATNSGSNRFRIEASIVALTGGLAAADNVTRKRQILDIYGSITQKYRRGVGSGSLPIGSSTGGFMKGYRFDARLYNDHALLMPTAPLMALESWLAKSAE
ncbi:MAG: hypothetical protein AB1428_04630 [Bacteroidota bacterium]